MAYSERLAICVRRALGSRRGVTEREMMGGLCFMLRGHMCCGVVDDDLMVRVGAEQHGAALAEPHARPMDFTGRSLKGFVFVGAAGCRTQRAVARWVERGVHFVSALPAKMSKRRGARSVED